MSTLTITQINAAVDAAFATALTTWNAHAADAAQPALQRSPAQTIGDGVTLRTDVYTGPRGAGFAVVAGIAIHWRTVQVVKQHGPETHRDAPAPTVAELVAECRKRREAAYPPQADYMDAKAKQSSPDEGIAAAGLAQEHTYLAACLSVKAKFPKPTITQ